jgi:hypothetical protein
MKNLKKILIAFFVVSLAVVTSCSEEDLTPSIDQQKTVEGSIKTTADMKGVLLGAYNRMGQSPYYGRDYIIYNEVRTDNVFANGNSGRFVAEGRFKLLPSYADPNDTWLAMYSTIASANIIIALDPAEVDGDIGEFNDYKGQALAMRALVHFDALKLYGQMHTGGTLGVPYVTTYKGDDLYPSRNTIEEDKNFIIQDLKDAKALMSSSYDDPLRQMIGAATPDALLSRVYLYFGMYPEARDAAKAVIDTHTFSVMSESNYVASFATDGSSNTLFALANSETDNLGNTGLGYIYRGSAYGDIEVLQNAADLFEAGDVRGMNGIIGMEGSMIRNLGKYPTLNGYDDINVVRYEEVLLNYAEALWRINNADTNVIPTLNQITSQRGASPITSVDLDVILNERRKELMFEGFRFDDLMRTGSDIEKIDANQGFTATIPYGDFNLAFPIPDNELNANSNMVQNTGY